MPTTNPGRDRSASEEGPIGGVRDREEPAALPSGRDEIRNRVIPRLIRWRNRREPLVCDIAEALATDIVFQDFKAHDPLNSVDLARRFGVSRTPVREALALLEQEGMVEIRARRTALVAGPSISEVREVYRLRGHLLALMARELAPKVTAEQLAVLGQSLSRMRMRLDAHDRDGYFAEAIENQDLMLEFAGDLTLKRVVDSLALRVLVMRYIIACSPGRLENSLDELEQLHRAIASRDCDLAAAAMSYTIRRAFRTLETVLENMEASESPV